MSDRRRQDYLPWDYYCEYGDHYLESAAVKDGKCTHCQSTVKRLIENRTGQRRINERRVEQPLYRGTLDPDFLEPDDQRSNIERRTND